LVFTKVLEESLELVAEAAGPFVEEIVVEPELVE
jgi:hypothetical protein